MNVHSSLKDCVAVSVQHPSKLSREDVDEWNALRSAHLEYGSPLLSPEFAQVIGETREDARVLLIRDGEGLECAFAFFKRPDGAGRSMGAPFCDYSGPIVRAGASLSLKQIIEAAGLSAWQTPALVDPWDCFVDERSDPQATMVIRLDDAPDEYLEAQRKKHPKRFKNFRRLDSQAQRDGHELVFRHGPIDSEMKAELFRHKSAQYVASGLVDLTETRLSRDILEAVANSEHGFCTSLWAGSVLISAHFGIRVGEAFHPWIAAYNPDFAHYSPGNLLLKRIIEVMPEMGLREYDLAEGHDHYKKYYVNSGRNVYTARVTSGTLRGRWKSAQAGMWRLAGADRDGAAVQRLRRRLDHISASDPRLKVRFMDLMRALKTRGIKAQNSAHSDTVTKSTENT